MRTRRLRNPPLAAASVNGLPPPLIPHNSPLANSILLVEAARMYQQWDASRKKTKGAGTEPGKSNVEKFRPELSLQQHMESLLRNEHHRSLSLSLSLSLCLPVCRLINSGFHSDMRILLSLIETGAGATRIWARIRFELLSWYHWLSDSETENMAEQFSRGWPWQGLHLSRTSYVRSPCGLCVCLCFVQCCLGIHLS